MASFVEMPDQPSLELESGVVTAEEDAHGRHHGRRPMPGTLNL
jgi:hypothetical protein